MPLDLAEEITKSRNNVNSSVSHKPKPPVSIAPPIIDPVQAIDNAAIKIDHDTPDHFTTDYVESILSGIPAAPDSVINPDFNSYTINGATYARATGVIDHRATSNDFKHVNLREWKEDCLLNGFFNNPNLIGSYQDAPTSRARREVKKQARVLGGAEDGVNYGTLIHGIMEAWVANPDKLAVFHKTLPSYLFNALLENIDLFNRHGLKVVSSENIVIVSEDPKIAGTFDSAVQDSSGEYFIHDYKSTKTSSLPLSLPGYELQMYAYAQAKKMVTKDGSIVDKPVVNQDYGFITHTPLDGPARMIKVKYDYAKQEFPVVLESFAAQLARDEAIENINSDRAVKIEYLG